MNTISAEIKPCPFCGGNAKAVHHHYKASYQAMRATFTGLTSLDARTLWTVRCTNKDCPVSPFTSLEDDKENGIKRWNTRSFSSAPQTEDVEALAEKIYERVSILQDIQMSDGGKVGIGHKDIIRTIVEAINEPIVKGADRCPKCGQLLGYSPTTNDTKCLCGYVKPTALSAAHKTVVPVEQKEGWEKLALELYNSMQEILTKEGKQLKEIYNLALDGVQKSETYLTDVTPKNKIL
jgi:hypothetical protein